MPTRGADQQTWLVTGCSTGLGRALAEAILERSHDHLVATARTPAAVAPLAARDAQRVLTAALDVRQADTIDAAVAAALDAFGRIDVVVNCAGLGLVGSVEESSVSEVTAVFDTNLFGTHRLVQAVLPQMRRQGSGRIAAITSKGAFQGQAACAVYCASKAAITGLFEGLAEEVGPLGIDVVLIEPGFIDTDFHTRGIMHAATRIHEYDGTCGYLWDIVADPALDEAGAIDLAAAAVYAAMTAEHPPRHLPLGADAMEMIRAKLAFVSAELDAWEDVALSVTPSGLR